MMRCLAQAAQQVPPLQGSSAGAGRSLHKTAALLTGTRISSRTGTSSSGGTADLWSHPGNHARQQMPPFQRQQTLPLQAPPLWPRRRPSHRTPTPRAQLASSSTVPPLLSAHQLRAASTSPPPAAAAAAQLAATAATAARAAAAAAAAAAAWPARPCAPWHWLAAHRPACLSRQHAAATRAGTRHHLPRLLAAVQMLLAALLTLASGPQQRSGSRVIPCMKQQQQQARRCCCSSPVSGGWPAC